MRLERSLVTRIPRHHAILPGLSFVGITQLLLSMTAGMLSENMMMSSTKMTMKSRWSGLFPLSGHSLSRGRGHMDSAAFSSA